MIVSMTGFGKGKGTMKNNRVECDLKSVNHRFLEINIRIPKDYMYLESIIREGIGRLIHRGRVDCFLSIDAPASLGKDVKIDMEMADKYVKAFRRLGKKTGIGGDVSLDQLVSQPGVINVIDREGDLDIVERLTVQAVDQATKRMAAMRKSEGKALKADILGRCKIIAGHVRRLEKAVPEVQKRLEEKVKKRVKDAFSEMEVDRDRLTQETAYHIMKSDVSEELTRLANHMDQIGKVMRKGGVIGRKIDFLLQEANREITTCGNKIQGMDISSLVVEIKSELEKIREQIQNVE
jgi:uncharacterized protein (TIGR00255 family)